jgi:hypothetical protein
MELEVLEIPELKHGSIDVLIRLMERLTQRRGRKRKAACAMEQGTVAFFFLELFGYFLLQGKK